MPGLAQPGGNVTGMVWVTPEYAGKVLEVFKEAVPKARRLPSCGIQRIRDTLLRYGPSSNGPPESWA